MSTFSDDGVHFKISEPFLVRLHGPYSNADPVRNGHAAASDGSLPVFQAVPEVLL